MELKLIENVRQGDIISLDKGKAKHVFNHKCMRQNGLWEVYTFGGGFSGIYAAPHTEVRFYGKTDNVSLWDADEKKKYTMQLWNTIKTKLPIKVVEKLEPLYGGKLFGKRGQYSLQEKEWFIRDYKRVMKLRDILKEHKGIEGVEVRTEDDIENLDYSIAMESECYGHRNYYITLICSNGERISI